MNNSENLRFADSLVPSCSCHIKAVNPYTYTNKKKTVIRILLIRHHESNLRNGSHTESTIFEIVINTISLMATALVRQKHVGKIIIYKKMH